MSNPTRFRHLIYGWDDTSAKNYGGPCAIFTAGANLNYGEVVYVSTTNTVNKSATAATVGATFAGVVIGGDLTNDLSVLEATVDAGITATFQVATSGKNVLVQLEGIVQVIGGAVVNVATRLIGDTTAGRVITGTTAGSVLGYALEAGALDTLFKAMLMRR